MQYWIVENNERVGPLTANELLAREVTAETLVWHEGLTEWTALEQIEELKIGLERKNNPDAMVDYEEVVETPAEQHSTIEPTAKTASTTDSDTPKNALPPCPPSNLVWAVISLLCCCFPLSVVAIIFGSQVSSKYNIGDYDGAMKASERAAWWTILSIVVGLVAQPFIMLLQIIGEA